MVSKKKYNQLFQSHVQIYIYIYISGNTCVCLAEPFWTLIYEMQYFEMYMIYDKMVSLLGRDHGLGRHTLKFCLTKCYKKLRVKIHHYIFTETTQTL